VERGERGERRERRERRGERGGQKRDRRREEKREERREERIDLHPPPNTHANFFFADSCVPLDFKLLQARKIIFPFKKECKNIRRRFHEERQGLQIA
jgi:hypothetical protein